MNTPPHPARHPHRTALILAATLATLPIPAPAQPTDRQDASARLSSALIRLNHNPRDADALTAAGNAALATGDTDAAVGFFTRALRLSPDNPQIEAGLAGAKVHAEDPLSAIPLFAAAEKGGAIAPELQADRGLAYDLIGYNASAQYYYKQALASAPAGDVSAEISRRLALSLAIGGDRRASELVLSALLQKQDRAAWRARIFALAILGFEEEAVSTARATMPPDLALQIAPYLRYMRRLTPAQQAAAANLGHFPQAADIGHDDPRIAQFARTVAQTVDRPQLAGADQRLVPTGAPLGNTPAPAAAPPPAKTHRHDRAEAPAPAIGAAPPQLPPEPIASRETQLAGPGQLTSAPAPKPLEPPRPTRVVQTPPPPRPAAPTPAPPPQAPAAPLVASTATAPSVQPMEWRLKPSPAKVEPAPQHPAEPAARPSFSDAFATMSPVIVDITPERGAVDLRKIKPARATPPPPPPPSHPSRIWVELGVGRDPDRIAFDWRRMVKDDPELFSGKKPFVTGWVRTNRLLVGPFDTDKAANSFTERLHKADHPSAFVWTSPAGQVVDPLE